MIIRVTALDPSQVVKCEDGTLLIVVPRHDAGGMTTRTKEQLTVEVFDTEAPEQLPNMLPCSTSKIRAWRSIGVTTI